MKREGEILVETRRLIAERGYRGLTTLDIAKACGVTEGAIFRYFPTKQHLLARVSEDWFREIIESGHDLTQYASPRDRLWHAIANMLSEIRREPELSRFVLMELRYESGYLSTELYRLNRVYTGRIKAAIQDNVDAGLLRSDIPVRFLRNMVIGAIEQETWSYLLDAERRANEHLEVENVTNLIFEVIWRGSAVDANAARNDRILQALVQLEHRLDSVKAEPEE